jgi:hypothetical protein
MIQDCDYRNDSHFHLNLQLSCRLRIAAGQTN